MQQKISRFLKNITHWNFFTTRAKNAKLPYWAKTQFLGRKTSSFSAVQTLDLLSGQWLASLGRKLETRQNFQVHHWAETWSTMAKRIKVYCSGVNCQKRFESNDILVRGTGKNIWKKFWKFSRVPKYYIVLQGGLRKFCFFFWPK
jgi:hypothetical protein